MTKGLLKRIHWKVSEGRIPVQKKDCSKGSNKMDRNLVISTSTDGSGEREMSLELVESASPSTERNTALMPLYDPQELIKSATTDWVMRRGLTDRAIWNSIASSARNICAEMIRVDEMNARLETGKLLFQRRDQGYYGYLHHPFHNHPCLPAVGNYPLSVMGALLSPGLEQEFRSTDTFGTAMEAIAFDWSRIQGMEDHIELMAWVAKLVHPFIVVGGRGTVVNSEFIWQRGRDQLMEFLQAATCADELEDLWKQMDDDDDPEVDPSGMVLEISGQQDAVFGQGSDETPLPIEDAGSETTGDTGFNGKAPEVSPEEEKTSGSSRLSGTRMFLWNVYSRVVPDWDFSIQDRSTGRIFDSTKGYPGEGPSNGDSSTSSKRNMPWISEDHLDHVVGKRMEMSSDMSELDGFVPEGEGQLEKVEVENVVASKVLRALWLKGFRAGQRKLCRAGRFGSQVVGTTIPANRVWSLGVRKPLLKMLKKTWFGCIWLRSQGKTNRGIVGASRRFSRKFH